MSKNPRSRGLSPLLLASAVAASLIVAVLVGLNLDSGDDSQDRGAPAAAEPSERAPADEGEEEPDREADSGDPMSLGAADAPVVMVVYADHMCPFCAAWERDTLPELAERYVDSGDLRIEARAFPYLGDRSHALAVGAEAAARQELFWEYQEQVFLRQDEIRSAGDPEPVMVEIADQVGMDQDQFTEDLDDASLTEAVDQDFAEGQQLGLSGTPSFLINDEPLLGAQPMDVFEARIDEALAAEAG
ncbi:DsbA family protein [Nocardiopsis ganjiahuensis]|uniref:DsbA family protein n=1 Tax=Nocardiopsis ganjiahuensis TaxID=239984 RepID=UPI00034584C4|nr:thioredoxin domain-containing protein [Nocardiopsis ganjiahuensis]